MKLAKLIAEEHYRGTDEVMARGMLENIVAAKLEPVIGMLRAIAMLPVGELVWRSTAIEGGKIAEQALALFEEDS